MLTDYGHVKIEWGDNEYLLSPTFANIAKIGKPKDIIDDFKDFVSTTNLVVKFSIALNVIKCCCDKELPRKLIGAVTFSEKQQKFMIVNPLHGESMISDVITLAEHCFIHGICGKTKKKGKGDPLTSFDAYSYMEMARIHLGLSLDDASRMTMTEFTRLMAAKFPPERNENQGSDEEQLALLEWLDKDKAH